LPYYTLWQGVCATQERSASPRKKTMLFEQISRKSAAEYDIIPE